MEMINRRQLLIDGATLGLAACSFGTLGHLLLESAEGVEAAEPVQAADISDAPTYPSYFTEDIVWVTDSKVVGKYYIVTYPYEAGVKIAAVKEHPGKSPFQRTIDRLMNYRQLSPELAEKAYFYHLSGISQAYYAVVQHFGGLDEAPIEAINEYLIENGLE